MGKTLDAVLSIFAFVIFLWIMYRMNLTLSDIERFFSHFFGFAALCAASKRRMDRRREMRLRIRVVEGILNTLKGKAVLLILMLVLLPMLSANAYAAPPPSVSVFSVSPNSPNTTLTLRNGQSGTMFADWTFVFSGTGSYSVYEKTNGSKVEMATGYSPGNSELNLTFSAPLVSVYVEFAGSNFSYPDERIVQFLSPVEISSVTVTSVLPGSSQVLSVPAGDRGVLMFPVWTVKMESSENVSYTVALNGRLIANGSVSGTGSVTFNVSSGPVTLVVAMGSKTYNFPGELIAKVPLDSYFTQKKSLPLVATLEEVIFGTAKGVIVILLFLAGSFVTVRPWTMKRMSRSPMRWF